VDVAREAGVSRATASLVIRNSPLVAAATREKVELAIDKLGYVKNLTAARLRAEQNQIVGLVVPNLSNPFFARLLAGIEEALDEANLAVFLANSHDDPERQRDVLQRMREHGVNGVIICPATGTPGDWHEHPTFKSMPTVQVLRHVTDSLDYIGVDYKTGVQEAVDHLVGLGHTQISFAVHGRVHSAYTERVEGFVTSMSRHGLDSQSLVQMPERIADIPAAARRIFQQRPGCTATLCFNDVIAIGLTAGLQDLGLQIGRDHSLIGFDDVHDGEVIRPALTSVATYPTVIGRSAGERMIERLKDRKTEPERQILSVDLRLRHSSGPLQANPAL
jgi:LacI family transcriptional regulator